MPITLIWDDAEKSILRWQFSDPWTWEEIEVTEAEATARHDAATDPIYTILDFRDSRRVPKGILLYFPDVARMLSNHPMGGSPIVVMGTQGILMRFAEILERWSALAVLADGLEDAHALIEKTRRSGDPPDH